MNKALLVLTSALSITYPILFLFGLDLMPFRGLLLLIALPLVLRFFLQASPKYKWKVLALSLLVLGAVALNNDPQWFLYTPVLINLGLLGLFWGSLRRPTPIIERFARLHNPNLSPREVRYCRQVTKAWGGMFIVNGAVAFFLAWTDDLHRWALYNGVLAYVLVGLFFAVELALRLWLRRKHKQP